MKKVLVAAWFDPEDKRLLAKVCEERRENFSVFIRRATMQELARLHYLPAEAKKALGIVAK
jgi:hypothetical protein